MTADLDSLRFPTVVELAAYDPDDLLVGHGPALHEPQAAVALREAMERSRRDLPRALTELLKMARGTRGDRG